MYICLYMRMSTDKQENSIESQRVILSNYAKSHGMIIVNEYTDEGISGRKADKRPAFMQMVEDSASGMFQAVLIYDSSRFARNLEESLVYKSILKKNGVALISATEPTLDDDTSLITDALLGAMNEMYSRKLSKTVKRGMQFRIEQGYFQNKPPFGYISANDGGVAQVHEEQAETVKLIFDLFTTSLPSFLGIAKELNRRGIKTQYGNYWIIRDVKRILLNVSYIGNIPWNPSSGIVYKGNHQPLVSEEIFELAQDIIKTKPKRRRDSNTYSHWLSGVIRCGKCGRTMGYNPCGERGARFRCTGNTRGLCYPTISISVKKAEGTFLAMLTDIVDGKYELAKEYVLFKEDDKASISALENELNKLHRKLKRHKQAYEEEIDTIEEYKQNKKTVQQEIERIRIQIKQSKAKEFNDSIKDKIRVDSLMLSHILTSGNLTIMQKSNALQAMVHHLVYDKDTDKLTVFFIS